VADKSADNTALAAGGQSFGDAPAAAFRLPLPYKAAK